MLVIASRPGQRDRGRKFPKILKPPKCGSSPGMAHALDPDATGPSTSAAWTYEGIRCQAGSGAHSVRAGMEILTPVTLHLAWVTGANHSGAPAGFRESQQPM
jgi:hypothetical protein